MAMANAGRQSEYKDDYALRLEQFVDNPMSLVVRGKISDTKVAALFGVCRETVRKWRTQVPGREAEFRPEFAAVYDKCRNALDAGEIKRSMITRAKGYTQVKKKKELTNVGPSIPGLSSMSKPKMAAEAKRVLDMELDPDSMDAAAMEGMIREELEKHKKMKLVVTAEERCTMAGDVNAAKLALSNIDRGEDKWAVTDKVEHSGAVKLGLAELLEEADGDGFSLDG